MTVPLKQPIDDSHCAACGAPYAAPYAAPDGDWPRACTACGTVAYRNPLPVAIALLPVVDARGTGLVVITRTIEPQLGGLALPGGFIDLGETWQDAVVRELHEETGIEAPVAEVRLADALSSPSTCCCSACCPPARPTPCHPRGPPTRRRAGNCCANRPS